MDISLSMGNPSGFRWPKLIAHTLRRSDSISEATFSDDIACGIRRMENLSSYFLHTYEETKVLKEKH